MTESNVVTWTRTVGGAGEARPAGDTGDERIAGRIGVSAVSGTWDWAG